jgi:hypothetical protein
VRAGLVTARRRDDARRTKIADPMRASSFRFSRRCLAWLLWIGLLLPVAQVAAAAHALSHASQEASRNGDGTQAAAQAHCDLCLIGAAIGAAAPLAERPTLTTVTVSRPAPQAASAELPPAVPVLAYRSRAPPDASR